MRFPKLPRTPARVRVLAAIVLSASAMTGCKPSGRPEAQIESTAPPSPEVVEKLVGPGCAAYTKKYATGPGSVAAIANLPAASAIESHPMLTKFSAAISGGLNAKVNLATVLNVREYTVFAPTDAAFRAKVPDDWARTLARPGSAEALTDLLKFHLVAGQRNPSDLDGQIGAQKLTIRTDGDRIRVADQANVVCGGLRTANATIYLIDSVLMPPKAARTT